MSKSKFDRRHVSSILNNTWDEHTDTIHKSLKIAGLVDKVALERELEDLAYLKEELRRRLKLDSYQD